MPKRRVIARNIFETLHFSALAAGGVGAGYSRDPFKPSCYVEHIVSIEDEPRCHNSKESSSWISLLYSIGITRETNDRAVRAINKRNGEFGTKWAYKCPNPKRWCDDDDWGRSVEDRDNGADRPVEFEAWVKELGLEPDDSDAEYGELFDVAPTSFDPWPELEDHPGYYDERDFFHD